MFKWPREASLAWKPPWQTKKIFIYPILANHRKKLARQNRIWFLGHPYGCGCIQGTGFRLISVKRLILETSEVRFSSTGSSGLRKQHGKSVVEVVFYSTFFGKAAYKASSFTFLSRVLLRQLVVRWPSGFSWPKLSKPLEPNCNTWNMFKTTSNNNLKIALVTE